MAAASLDVLLLHNKPALPTDHPDYASEAGVLESVAAVAAALQTAGHRVRTLGLGDAGRFAGRAAPLGPARRRLQPVRGLCRPGRGEALVAGWIEALGLPLTGCDAAALELVRDKARVKWLLRGAGLADGRFRAGRARSAAAGRGALASCWPPGRRSSNRPTKTPAWASGRRASSSDRAALDEQIALVAAGYGPVLVERFIAGREFNAAVLATARAAAVAAGRNRICRRAFRARAAGDLRRQMGFRQCRRSGHGTALPGPGRACSWAGGSPSVALAAFEVTGCRDYARVDLRVADDDGIYILEINGNPDIGPSAGFARALRAAGIEYADFVERLVRTAAYRCRTRRFTRGADDRREVIQGCRPPTFWEGQVTTLHEFALSGLPCEPLRPLR